MYIKHVVIEAVPRPVLQGSYCISAFAALVIATSSALPVGGCHRRSPGVSFLLQLLKPVLVLQAVDTVYRDFTDSLTSQ